MSSKVLVLKSGTEEKLSVIEISDSSSADLELEGISVEHPEMLSAKFERSTSSKGKVLIGLNNAYRPRDAKTAYTAGNISLRIVGHAQPYIQLEDQRREGTRFSSLDCR